MCILRFFFVIRSKDDKFFCDNLAVNFLKLKGIKIVEIEGGHNWNKETEKAMNNLIIYGN